MLKLDHLAISAMSLGAGRDFAENVLGIAVQTGGRHDHFGTHNLLLGFEDDTYLEVISVDPDAPDPGRPRWFDLDSFSGPPRLSNWICRSDELERDLARIYGDNVRPLSLRRGDLSWRMGIPEDGRLPFDNLFPALIEWDTAGGAAARLVRTACRLRSLVVFHPRASALEQALAGLLEDSRVSVRAAPEPGLRAVIATPAGEVTL